MKALVLISVCLLAVPAMLALPVILPHGIQNAASYKSSNFRDSGIAPGSIFVIKGSGLGPETLVESAGGTDVLVRSIDAGLEIHPPILHSWSWQVAAILPDDFPLGPAELVLTYAGETTAPVSFNVVVAAPGLFTIAQNGRGPGVVQNFESPSHQPLNGLTSPAHPGQYIILWGTGLGRLPASDYEVHIGEVRLPTAYAGPAPGYPGLDQINVRLPDDGSIPAGCYVNLSLRAGDTSSFPVSIATAGSSGPCDHPWDLSPAQLARLDAGESLPWASLRALTSPPYPGATEHDAFSAELRRLAPWEVAVHAEASGGFFPPDPSGSCFGGRGDLISFTTIGGEPVPGYVPRPGSLTRPVLDAGESLRLTGPAGKELELVKPEGWEWLGAYQPDGNQAATPKAFFDAGLWTLSAPGGSDIGPFTASLTLPPPVRAELPETVDRSRDLTVTWDPGGLVGDTMVVSVVAFGAREPDPDNPGATRIEVHEIQCHAAPADGSVTIPADLLVQSFASEEAAIGLSLLGAPGYTVRFTTPGIEYATFTQTASYSQSAVVR